MHASSSSGSGDETSSSNETTPSIFQSMFKFASNFVLGGIAGGIGVLAVYPIDLVKTRMQIDGQGASGTRRFATTLHCFRAIVATEGVGALYRGVAASLLREGTRTRGAELVRSRSRRRRGRGRVDAAERSRPGTAASAWVSTSR